MAGRDSTKSSYFHHLALSCGRSLDLADNCRCFLEALVCGNILGASVWVAGECVSEAAPPSASARRSFLLVAALPNAPEATSLPFDHPLAKDELARYDVVALQPEDPRAVGISAGRDEALTVFSLGEAAILVTSSLLPLSTHEVEAYRPSVDAFAISVRHCLQMQELQRHLADKRTPEEQFRESLDRYRDLAEQAFDGVVLIQNGRIEYASGRLLKAIAAPDDHVLGEPFTKYVHPDYSSAAAENYRRRMTGGHVPPVYEAVLARTDGSPIHVEVTAGLIAYQDQPADLVFIRDITERKTGEMERARLAMAVEQTADAVIITGLDGAIQYVNPAFERMTGYTRAEVLGKNPRLLKSGKQDDQLYRNMWATLARGEVWLGRFQNRKKDGSLYTCDTIITPTRDESGAVINYVSVQRDVSREIQMEEQYLQAQKMESMGRLAGGIAHDFNNIMTAVLGFGSMILDQLADGHPMKHAAEQIVSAGERATNLTRQLLTFSRKQMIEVRLLELNSVVMEMYQLLKRALGEDIDLITLLDEDAGCVKADSGLLQQVIMNLAINARDAMPRGGQLTILTAKTRFNEPSSHNFGGLQPGEYIQLTIRDTGGGMPKSVIAHAFEPFFTTKPKGKGTGLGLATVYGIVRQFGGHVEIESEVGHGTEIRIWLPRSESSNDTLHVELEDKVQPGHETIMVVEDEDLVRDLTVRILKSLGYQVIQAPNGRDALTVISKYTGKIDLVLTDVVMPHMGGPEMVEKLSTIRPGLKVLYTSGFTESAVVERGVALGKIKLVQKPYTREVLAQKIRLVLDER